MVDNWGGLSSSGRIWDGCNDDDDKVYLGQVYLLTGQLTVADLKVYYW